MSVIPWNDLSISSWPCINYYLNHLFQPLQPCKQAESPSNTSWAFVWAAWNCTLHRQQATAERSTKGTTDNKWNCHWIHCIFIKATRLCRLAKQGLQRRVALSSSSQLLQLSLRRQKSFDGQTTWSNAKRRRTICAACQSRGNLRARAATNKNAVALSWWWQTGGLREKDRSFGDYD